MGARDELDPGCCCEGNWRRIVKDYEPLIGREFQTDDGTIWRFFGIVWSDDDFYYGMSSRGTSSSL